MLLFSKRQFLKSVLAALSLALPTMRPKKIEKFLNVNNVDLFSDPFLLSYGGFQYTEIDSNYYVVRKQTISIMTICPITDIYIKKYIPSVRPGFKRECIDVRISMNKKQATIKIVDREIQYA